MTLDDGACDPLLLQRGAFSQKQIKHLRVSNAIFDVITAAQLTEIDLHCCETLAQRWHNTDDVGPLLIQHWAGTPNWDKIG